MLQIALAPAAVAARELDQVGRQLLIAALDFGQHPHRVAGAAHQGGFDEVVAEDLAAHRRTPGQAGQPAMRGEGRQANDRIVAPVVAVTPLPEAEAGGQHGPIEPAAELQHAREQGLSVHRQREALDDPHVGVALHQAHQLGQQPGRQDAVGVQDHHEVIGAAPTTAEIRDVADLSLPVVGPPPIEPPGIPHPCVRAAGRWPAPPRAAPPASSCR